MACGAVWCLALLLQRIQTGEFKENIFLNDDKLGLLHDPLDYSMLPDLEKKKSIQFIEKRVEK